jgi:hypothetical protein
MGSEVVNVSDHKRVGSWVGRPFLIGKDLRGLFRMRLQVGDGVAMILQQGSVLGRDALHLLDQLSKLRVWWHQAIVGSKVHSGLRIRRGYLFELSEPLGQDWVFFQSVRERAFLRSELRVGIQGVVVCEEALLQLGVFAHRGVDLLDQALVVWIVFDELLVIWIGVLRLLTRNRRSCCQQ